MPKGRIATRKQKRAIKKTVKQMNKRRGTGSTVKRGESKTGAGGWTRSYVKSNKKPKYKRQPTGGRKPKN